MFPRIVSKRYGKYAKFLKDMQVRFEHEYAGAIRANNNRLLNRFVRYPLSLGILASFLWMGYDSRDFITQGRSVTMPKFKVRLNRPPEKWLVKKSNIPVKLIHFYPAAIGYGIAMAGSIFLSLNIGFKKENELKKALQHFRYVNENGEPWDVCWTPDAILFYSHNANPDSVMSNASFWASVNFKAAKHPKVAADDARVFLAIKSAELPKTIVFEPSKVPGWGSPEATKKKPVLEEPAQASVNSEDAQSLEENSDLSEE
nr:hypothetical protein BdHM001_35800 [Bdellovibrio sp. HM001]